MCDVWSLGNVLSCCHCIKKLWINNYALNPHWHYSKVKVKATIALRFKVTVKWDPGFGAEYEKPYMKTLC